MGSHTLGRDLRSLLIPDLSNLLTEFQYRVSSIDRAPVPRSLTVSTGTSVW